MSNKPSSLASLDVNEEIVVTFINGWIFSLIGLVSREAAQIYGNTNISLSPIVYVFRIVF